MSSADAPWLLGASGQVGYFLQQRCGDAVVPCARSVPHWATDRAGHWRLFETLFGGATRSFLAATDGPNLLLSH